MKWNRVRRLIAGLLLAGCALLTGQRAEAGVMVEGSASGLPHVTSLSYDAGANRFVLNGGETASSPVSREELLELIAALRLDDRVGVSVKLDNGVIVYGQLRPRSPVVHKLENTDNFFRAIVFGEAGQLKDKKLPGNYTPKIARNREYASVILLQMDGFTFFRSGSAYYPKDVNATILLVPMAKYTAPDGGYLPDFDALEKGEFQPEDKENADHLQANKDEYLKMEIVANSVRVGEAAALLRYFRDCGISLEALQDSIDKRDGKTMQGNPTPSAPVASRPGAEPEGGIVAPPALNAPVPAIPAEATAPVEQDVPSAQTPASVLAGKPAAPAVPVTPALTDSIRRVLAQDMEYGSSERIKLTRSTVNDGSYYAFRLEYVKKLEALDLSGCPADFQKAFRDYAATWAATVKWLESRKIPDGEEAFAAFSDAHAPFRKDLRTTYNECRRIAAQYGVKTE